MTTPAESETEMLKYINEVLDTVFKDSPNKIDLWWMTPNPFLGEISPHEMVMRGRMHKVYRFVKATQEGDYP